MRALVASEADGYMVPHRASAIALLSDGRSGKCETQPLPG